jgi:hypothetical protein
VSGLETVGWVALAAVSGWGIAAVRARARIARLRTQWARRDEAMQQEIERLHDVAARARIQAAQIARDAASWAAGWREGRDDVITLVPRLVPAQDRPPDAGTVGDEES